MIHMDGCDARLGCSSFLSFLIFFFWNVVCCTMDCRPRFFFGVFG